MIHSSAIMMNALKTQIKMEMGLIIILMIARFSFPQYLAHIIIGKINQRLKTRKSQILTYIMIPRTSKVQGY